MGLMFPARRRYQDERDQRRCYQHRIKSSTQGDAVYPGGAPGRPAPEIGQHRGEFILVRVDRGKG